MAYSFTATQGRRCRIASHSLADLERNYHPCDCQCALCAEETDMPQPRRPQPRRINTFHVAPSDQVLATCENGQSIETTGAQFLAAASGDELHRRVTQLRRQRPELTYSQALREVGRHRPDLVAKYAQRNLLVEYDAGDGAGLKAGDSLREEFELPVSEQRALARGRLLQLARDIMQARNTNTGPGIGPPMDLRGAVAVVLNLGAR